MLIAESYIPGWDCHGLPIEARTLKELRVCAVRLEQVCAFHTLQKEAHELPAYVIRKAAKAVAEREIETQKGEFRELAVMGDWGKEGTYRTLGKTESGEKGRIADKAVLDRTYELRQLRLFQKMVEKGQFVICTFEISTSRPRRSDLPELPTCPFFSVLSFCAGGGGAELS